MAKNEPAQQPAPSFAEQLAAMSNDQLAQTLGAERAQQLLAVAAPELEVRAPEPMVRMAAPAEFTAFSHAGHEYRAENGFVSVPESAVSAAQAHGCELRDHADA